MGYTKTISIVATFIMIGSALSILCGPADASVSSDIFSEANPRMIYWLGPSLIDFLGETRLLHRTPVSYQLLWTPSGDSLMLISVEPDEVNVQHTMAIIINASDLQIKHKLSVDGSWFDRMGYSFALSPDETRIFFSNFSEDKTRLNIVSTNLDGSDRSVLASIESEILTTLIDVSPDGKFILYSERERVFVNYSTIEVSRIKKLDLETHNESLLVEFTGTITSLKISPQVDKIAFTAYQGWYTQAYEGLYVVNINGTGVTKIAEPPSGVVYICANWISDGMKIMFTEASREITWSGNEYNWENSNITTINPDGTGMTVIYRNGFAGTLSPKNNSVMAFLRFSDIGGVKFLPSLMDLTLPTTLNPDSDRDGLSDYEELDNFLNPCDSRDIIADYDDDGLTNYEEIQWRTYIGDRDSDKDGLSDGVEIKIFRTNPLKTDSDNDGVSDGLEAAATGLNAFVSVLPEGWIRMTLEWSNKTMYVTTNSSVLGVVFDSANMALSISVGGPNGTMGFANITVPMEMLSGLSAVSVTLDDQPVDFEIVQVGSYARIYVEYHHSYHELTAHLQSGGMTIGPGFVLPLWVIILIIAAAIVAVVLILFVIRKRNKGSEEKKKE